MLNASGRGKTTWHYLEPRNYTLPLHLGRNHIIPKSLRFETGIFLAFILSRQQKVIFLWKHLERFIVWNFVLVSTTVPGRVYAMHTVVTPIAEWDLSQSCIDGNFRSMQFDPELQIRRRWRGYTRGTGDPDVLQENRLRGLFALLTYFLLYQM